MSDATQVTPVTEELILVMEEVVAFEQHLTGLGRIGSTGFRALVNVADTVARIAASGGSLESAGTVKVGRTQIRSEPDGS